jgi:iron complex transport system ATP-binding protein
MKDLFALHRVRFVYHHRPILQDFSLTVQAGTVTALLGPNGSGKSTLLKLLLGILRPNAGRVLFQGRDLAAYSRRELAQRIAYLPQKHQACFAYTVADVVLMGRLPHAAFCAPFTREDRQLAEGNMERLGIRHLSRLPYTEISGGEQQLTLLARALTQGAAVFVMDEPEAALDYGNQIRLLEQVGSLAAEGHTFLFSTHSPEHALLIADRAILLRNGTIFRDGAPQHVMDQETVSALYGVTIKLMECDDGQRICLPQLLYKR